MKDAAEDAARQEEKSREELGKVQKKEDAAKGAKIKAEEAENAGARAEKASNDLQDAESKWEKRITEATEKFAKEDKVYEDCKRAKMDAAKSLLLSIHKKSSRTHTWSHRRSYHHLVCGNGEDERGTRADRPQTEGGIKGTFILHDVHELVSHPQSCQTPSENDGHAACWSSVDGLEYLQSPGKQPRRLGNRPNR